LQIETSWQIHFRLRAGVGPLELITRWCHNHSLPVIASLVVEKATGMPAPGFGEIRKDEVPREQERVWAFDWYGIPPPTIEELAEK
jgi:hypothetical protein